MNELFTIGDFCFRLIVSDEVVLPDNLLKFQGGVEPDYTYRISVSADFPKPQGNVLVSRNNILVLDNGGLEWRYIGTAGMDRPYACYREVSSAEADILLDPGYLHMSIIDPVFCSLLALERRQSNFDALILHCAYVELDGQAILFSAPSETGKTTQANLWERYRGAKTVNGDRGLIQKRNGRWIVRGWPVCGSSGVCINRELPIRAIVMLSQAPVDQADILTGAKAFTQIYSQITVNKWNRDASIRSMELLEELLDEVPVYHLACTMNETAVIALEKMLQSTEGGEVHA